MPTRLNLTEARARALDHPQAGRINVYDQQVQELALRITHTGAKSWYVVVWAEGRQRWIALGPLSRLPVDRARELAREALVKLDRKIDPVAEKREAAAKARETRAGGRIPLAEVLKRHLARPRLLKCSARHRQELERVAKAAIGAGVTDLASDNIAVKAREWLESLDVTEPTRHRYRVHLCAISRTALKEWPPHALPRDPFLSLGGEGVCLPEPPVFDPAEAVKIVADKALALQHGRLWAFLLYTGCRFREATWARWDRIRLDRATFDVVPPDAAEREAGAAVKRDKPRTVALPAELVSLLETWKPAKLVGTPFLFPAELRTRPHVYNTLDFRSHLEALGIPLRSRRIHSLRHTRQTLGVACGEDSLRLRLSMGHAGEDMGAHYARLAMRWRALLAGWNGDLRLRDEKETQRIKEALAPTCPSTDTCTVATA